MRFYKSFTHSILPVYKIIQFLLHTSAAKLSNMVFNQRCRTSCPKRIRMIEHNYKFDSEQSLSTTGKFTNQLWSQNFSTLHFTLPRSLIIKNKIKQIWSLSNHHWSTLKPKSWVHYLNKEIKLPAWQVRSHTLKSF